MYPEIVEMVQFLDPEIVEKVDKSFLNLLQLQNKLPGWGQMGWVAWTWLSLVITSFFKIKYHTMTMQYAFKPFQITFGFPNPLNFSTP